MILLLTLNKCVTMVTRQYYMNIEHNKSKHTLLAYKQNHHLLYSLELF